MSGTVAKAINMSDVNAVIDAALPATAICKTCGQGVDLAALQAHNCPGLGVATAWRLVILESPYAGDIETNVAYARAAMRDCLTRGDAPAASHLLYTQPGVLDDGNPAERSAGIDAGLAWGSVAEATVVYTDRGVSRGMAEGIARAHAEGRAVEFRTLDGWST
ncbi:hypothetical protein NKH10_19440 [Mesorhizobium sp. M1340]|uniref:DUF7768 domain-containing protein n=1 Tax=Mesorhizobium sp. M1340 TaxID=2957087 RepID=UPI003339AF65